MFDRCRNNKPSTINSVDVRRNTIPSSTPPLTSTTSDQPLFTMNALARVNAELGEPKDKELETQVLTHDDPSDDFVAIKQRMDSMALSMEEMICRMSPADAEQANHRLDTFARTMGEMALEVTNMSALLKRTMGKMQGQNDKMSKMVESLYEEMMKRKPAKQSPTRSQAPNHLAPAAATTAAAEEATDTLTLSVSNVESDNDSANEDGSVYV